MHGNEQVCYAYIIRLHRCIVAYCMGHIIQSEVDEFKREWNSHKIRANRKTLLPNGRPDDLFDMVKSYGMLIVKTDFIYICILYLGVENHLQPVNAAIWIHAMETESTPTPRFYNHSFELQANQLLRRYLKMKRSDINHENCITVYKFLLNNM